MKRTVIYPGSFNPMHEGHKQVIDIAKQIFDNVIIVIAQNANKPKISTQDIQERIEQIHTIYPDIQVIYCDYLICQLAFEMNAWIIKGVRNFIDFQNELDQASFNREKFGIETILIPSAPQFSYISSSLIRELKEYAK